MTAVSRNTKPEIQPTYSRLDALRFLESQKTQAESVQQSITVLSCLLRPKSSISSSALESLKEMRRNIADQILRYRIMQFGKGMKQKEAQITAIEKIYQNALKSLSDEIEFIEKSSGKKSLDALVI